LTQAEGFVLGMAKMFPVAVPGEYPWPLARLRLSPTAATRSPPSSRHWRGSRLAPYRRPGDRLRRIRQRTIWLHLLGNHIILIVGALCERLRATNGRPYIFCRTFRRGRRPRRPAIKGAGIARPHNGPIVQRGLAKIFDF